MKSDQESGENDQENGESDQQSGESDQENGESDRLNATVAAAGIRPQSPTQEMCTQDAVSL